MKTPISQEDIETLKKLEAESDVIYAKYELTPPKYVYLKFPNGKIIPWHSMADCSDEWKNKLCDFNGGAPNGYVLFPR